MGLDQDSFFLLVIIQLFPHYLLKRHPSSPSVSCQISSRVREDRFLGSVCSIDCVPSLQQHCAAFVTATAEPVFQVGKRTLHFMLLFRNCCSNSNPFTFTHKF